MKSLSTKVFKLTCGQRYFNGCDTSNETLEKKWTAELINQELEDLLSESDKVESAYLDYMFPKTDWTEEEMEDLLGNYGELEGECVNFYQVGWSKFK